MVVFLHVLGGFPQNVMIRFASYLVVTSWIDIAAFQNFRHERISLFDFMFRAKHYLGGAFRRSIHATNRISARLYKREQPALLSDSKIWCWPRRPSRSAFHSERNDEGECLLRLQENQYVLQISGLLLGLGLFSYHVRELMVCWLLFCLLFVLLVLLIFGGVLACYAGQCVIDWVSTTPRVTPVVTLTTDDLQLKTISDCLELKRVEPSGS